MGDTSIFESLMRALPALKEQHSPTSSVYPFLERVARKEVEARFGELSPGPTEFAPFGDLVLPYVNMGAVDSLNLFDLNELIIFGFYWVNRNRYRRVLDAGANIGLHSIVLNRCGMEVRAYEPDPEHFRLLERNLSLNQAVGVEAVNAAVSNKAGQSEFIRVLGNTTGSHIAGSKLNPYGDLERFPVRIEAFKPLAGWADLIKMDVEGHESQILLDTTRDDWLDTDAIVEISGAENASSIYRHFKSLKVGLFSQKKAWSRVEEVDEMPASYKDGSLFISCKNEMPWQ